MALYKWEEKRAETIEKFHTHKKGLMDHARNLISDILGLH